jgi:hypothetical protein
MRRRRTRTEGDTIMTTTTQRGLGWFHQQRRKALPPAALSTPCPVQGPTCDGIMVDPKRMQLDHSTPRSQALPCPF